MHGDVIVFVHPDGKTYVAVDDDGQWLRWPAEAGGWARRVACREPGEDACWELEPRLAQLALRLSGVR
jgi:uncharacterized protein YbdZ (MbtH family)